MSLQPLFEFEVSARQLRPFAAAVTALADVGREICLGVATDARGRPHLTLWAYDDAAT
eukprot:CAMPEP_0119280754 /NCGR_PEP_ID=MMETSP1329-20130426/23357_1 /TAXON_ID=114041 /ORGANISM="Genus nov. species nov., Strain RCC1024" /LENGTH=57 /DNA_ID=CAMNT_0007281351 /DNA_START=144 /DNA_END=313 /DNA_ORIENTATION=+